MERLNKRQQDALIFIVRLLRRKKIPFQISGGFAAKIYGSGRPLNDIDIDIPEKAVYELAPFVEKHIIGGPQHYVGCGWDLQLLELNFHGQLIDLCGVEHLKLFSQRDKRWIDYPGDLSRIVKKRAYGFVLPLMPAQELAQYKRHLRGTHQKVDVAALERLLSNDKN